MNPRFGLAPSAAEFEHIAQQALARIPAEFIAHITDIIIEIEDFADDELLTQMGIDNPFELTGLYEGVPITERSFDTFIEQPDRIRLFRRAILDEWAERGDETLEHLVAHVLIHEIGHHFGLSDEAMHALEESVS